MFLGIMMLLRSVTQEADGRTVWRTPDDMWALIEAAMVKARPLLRWARSESRRRQRQFDALVYVLRYDLTCSDVPIELASAWSVASFACRWKDGLCAVPGALREFLAYTRGIPPGVVGAFDRLAELDSWRPFQRTVAKLNVGVAVLAPVPPQAAKPAPSTCGWCGAGPAMMSRSAHDDGWVCVSCGEYIFDFPGTPLKDGPVGRPQVYPIATGKYSGR